MGMRYSVTPYYTSSAPLFSPPLFTPTFKTPKEEQNGKEQNGKERRKGEERDSPTKIIKQIMKKDNNNDSLSRPRSPSFILHRRQGNPRRKRTTHPGRRG